MAMALETGLGVLDYKRVSVGCEWSGLTSERVCAGSDLPKHHRMCSSLQMSSNLSI